MTKQNAQLFRQPIHTVYGGAHLFKSNVCQKLANIALKSFQDFAPNASVLAENLGESYSEKDLWDRVYQQVLQKLTSEAVEDFRLDFEDGYGVRSDLEEDQHAKEKALELARAMENKTLPPFIGIRVKSFSPLSIKRSKRTLDLFLTTMCKKTGGNIPENFVVTLPKVETKIQAATFEKFLTTLEKKLKLKSKSLRCELMVESAAGVLQIRPMVEATKGRCRGVHFGTYDYTASLGIISTFQTMSNPVCDFAKHLMQVNLNHLPLFLSDGATTLMPVGSDREILAAWQKSTKNILASLRTGFYQGWDLHPAQIPIRYVALYMVFLKSYEPSLTRLKTFLENSAKASLTKNNFDDAATGRGLLNTLLRGYYCGALSAAEIAKSGLTIEEMLKLQSRFDGLSFVE